MPDVLEPLERAIARYRRDVHGFGVAAAPDALDAVAQHLGHPLPDDLRTLLATHNGARLFRGQLRLRSTNELAAASDRSPMVTLFADGPGDQIWAWARRADGDVAWGQWDDGSFTPHHRTLTGWLASTIALVEARAQRPEEIDAVRQATDPDDPYVLARVGELALAAGRPDEAEAALLRATAADPSHARAWQLLGDALTIHDRTGARRAWLTALGRTSLPLPWPGHPCVDASIVRSIVAAMPEAEALEGELTRFMGQQVADAGSRPEVDLTIAVATAAARSKLRRGRRTEARDLLAELAARCATFSHRTVPWDAQLEMAQWEAGLGRYDDAEATLRRIRREGPPGLRGPALLTLAHIAVTREEPWAEEIVEEAVASGVDEVDRIRAGALTVERALRAGRLTDAATSLAAVAPMARRLSMGALTALTELSEGDLARANGDLNGAREAWHRALGRLVERARDASNAEATDPTVVSRATDPELAWRIVTRLGSLARDVGQHADADRFLRASAAGFASIELPVREAWALLRLGQLHQELGQDGWPALRLARERFLAADLPTGVAAVDATAGVADFSLDWHLERSAAHARARHDAQRARAPFERSDAERPERRLGAHRLAIATAGQPVVARLSQVLKEGAAASTQGRGRITDPPVLRYIAGVDLLAGHRSFEAADLLRNHLLGQSTDGPATQALQAAIARSPNAALVDGLLGTIESPGTQPPHAVALAAELIGLRREAAGIRPLVALAVGRGSIVWRKAAIVALGRIGDRSAIGAVASALDDHRLSEAAAIALLLLGDRLGVDFHARALAEGRTEGGGTHPGEIVGRFGGPEYLPLLRTVANSGDARAIGALHGLGLLGDPRAVDALLDALESRDRDTVAVCGAALTILTGHSEDLEESGFRNRWRAWWRGHVERFSPGIRHRDGRVFELGLLIDRLQDDDAWVRRSSYDELVIQSGQNLPFDADGPWRVQQAHLKAWRSWYHLHRSRFGAGRWFLDGRAIH